MTNRLADNLRNLRASHRMTQAALAAEFDLNRTTVSAWEDRRAEPRLAVLIELAKFFEVSVDELLFGDLSHRRSALAAATAGWRDEEKQVNLQDKVRVLPIAVDPMGGDEQITVVPVKAAAGYLDGYGDMEYIASLPTFRMPVSELPQDQTLRMFQIEGDSMLPLPSGSYVLASFTEQIDTAGNRHPYVIVTRNEGIVFKRIENRMKRDGVLRMFSDNAEFTPFDVALEDIHELWKARAYVSFELNPTLPLSDSLKDISDRLHRLETRLGE